MQPPFHPDYKIKVRPLNDIDAIGATYYEPREIHLDPFAGRNERADTALHEHFHAMYPEWGEREIEAWTTETLELMTPDEIQFYVDMFYQSRWRKIGNIILWIRSLEDL